MAKLAGVSQATVSMILNRKCSVSFSRETVRKVEQAAKELGYELPGTENRRGKMKKAKADRCILSDPYKAPTMCILLQGIESVANEQGYGDFYLQYPEGSSA